MGLSLFLFVRAENVYPQLLLARLLFSLGGSATATMVTATLPLMTMPSSENLKAGANATVEHGGTSNESLSRSSELTVIPDEFNTSSATPGSRTRFSTSSPTNIAGFVGLFTGLGALVALLLFLPLLAWLQKPDAKPGTSIVYTYHIVGTTAILVAVACFVGLRHLRGEEDKGLSLLRRSRAPSDQAKDLDNPQPSWILLLKSVQLGAANQLIGLGYLGGFVARASSVGISLFIPLYVNAYFISSGKCNNPVDNPSEIKSVCKEAYVLAAKLTGTSQLIALVMAPAFGYFADRYQQSHAAVLFAAFAGILGYVGLANLKSPISSGEDGNPIVFLFVSFIGVSQIGCIVCSLGLLGRGILGLETPSLRKAEGTTSWLNSSTFLSQDCFSDHHDYSSGDGVSEPSMHHAVQQNNDLADPEETTSLLCHPPKHPRSFEHLKGSIAGAYSFGGGVGILLLTKLGGYLFDTKSSGAPFYMLAIVNALLLVITGILAILTARRALQTEHRFGTPR